MPSTAFVLFVIRLSATDTLTIYELGNRARHWATTVNPPDLSGPDTQLLITRRGRPVSRFALKDLSIWREDYPGWAATLETMSVAHLCSPTIDITYLVLQSGNSSGYYIALQRAKQTYVVIPVSGAAQGRLILSKSIPEAVEVWSATDAGVCTACPKPLTIKLFRFDGLKFRLISQRQTKRSYVGFQDEPLVVDR